MIDFHSHILPGMDDGAKNSAMSIEMLLESARQGVTHICATPHFYAEENPPEEFLYRRADSVRRLNERLAENNITDIPKIRLGAEVKYFEGITRVDGLERLCIEGTSILLVEMPFMNWTPRMWQDIRELASRPELTVMLAHIERYLHYGAEKYLTNAPIRSIIIQSNAENFACGLFQRNKALKMLKNGLINVIGSDCHNMTSRPPMMAEAMSVIEKKAGKEYIDRIDAIGCRALDLKGYDYEA